MLTSIETVMNQTDPQLSEQRRGADAAFQQSLAQLETLLDNPEPQTNAAPVTQENVAEWETAGADLEAFLEVDVEE
ncbi:MAG: hypothetical protein F6J87_02490 [Spirulina sp. SIO3F2]|nr:hypothetical protein [Spirulina sp. SIO3F2]